MVTQSSSNDQWVPLSIALVSVLGCFGPTAKRGPATNRIFAKLQSYTRIQNLSSFPCSFAERERESPSSSASISQRTRHWSHREPMEHNFCILPHSGTTSNVPVTKKSMSIDQPVEWLSQHTDLVSMTRSGRMSQNVPVVLFPPSFLRTPAVLDYNL
jgi:hypothetical protein